MEQDFPKCGSYDILRDVQVLTPTKKGEAGTKNLNLELQKILNPKSQFKREKEYGSIIFREGDKVMQIRNNYDVYWESIDGKNYGSGVYNGDLGIINRITEDYIEVIFDDEKIIKYESSVLEELEHAYAITIHKSQGGEFPVVVMPITNGPTMLFTRNLLYTGVTRAKNMLIILGKEMILSNMIKNNETKSSNTGLVYKINKYQELFKSV